MLNARNIPRACQSCRLQLLSLFEHGFTTPSISNASRTRPSTRLPPRAFQPRNSALRTFSTSANRKDEAPRESAAPEVEEIESIVRRARQTFGQTLPKDYLSTEEYILYERLYGPPLRETQPDDLELHDLVWEDGKAEEEEPRNVLLRENKDGDFEEVDFDPDFNLKVFDEMGEEITSTTELDQYLSTEGSEGGEEILGEVTTEDEAQPIQFTATDQREYNAIQKLRRDLETSMAQSIEVEDELEEEYEEDEEEPEEDAFEEDEDENLEPYISSDTVRTHPHTMAGRSGTTPSTIYLPKEQFVVPFTELLERTNLKHVADAAEKAFGGKGLPNSTATRSSKNNLPQKHIGLDASQHRMTEIEADAYMASVMPGMYATVAGTLVEVRKRLGPEWIRNLLFREGGEGPKILDAGAGGAGLMAWREILQTEWDILKDDGIVHGNDAPSGKATVLTGSDALRHRMATMLDNTTFLPRLPDYVHASNSEAHLNGAPAQGRKSYDVIIAPHTLFPLKEEFRRKHMVQNLWSLLDPNGGVLILIEKGVPRGFEAIAGARSLLLDKHISSPESESIASETQGSVEEISTPKEAGMIVAPCTNHSKCPMYPVPGLTTGRKDFCHFEQRYIRPAYLQKILGATSRNYEDLKYSYLVVRRGVDERKAAQPLVQGDVASEQSFAGYEYQDLPEGSEEWAPAEPIVEDEARLKFNPLALPRVLLPALKRRGHVTFDLCTPSGKLERWTVPKSFSKQAYRDARKINWGDLWALGAKTRVTREPRLGKGLKVGNTGLKGVRDGKMGKGGKKAKKNMFEIQMGNEGMVGLKEVRPKHLTGRPEKRTKGGRNPKAPKPITEDDL